MQQRWKARWMEVGRWREFVFDSINDRKIARIDGRLLALVAGIRLPEHFALDEVEQKEQERWMLANEEKRLCTSCFATSARRISWRRIATIVSTRDAGQVQRLADEYVRCQADTVYSDARLDGCVFCSNLPGTRLLRPDEARG